MYLTEIYCYSANIFTVTFGQFNANLWNKIINFFQIKILLTVSMKKKH